MGAQSQQQRSKELVWKIIVVGDLATGKTSLIKRYVHDVFTSNYRATVCVRICVLACWCVGVCCGLDFVGNFFALYHFPFLLGQRVSVSMHPCVGMRV